MWYTIVNTVTRWADQLSSTQWFIVLIAVLVLGAMALKGFGLRARF